MGRETSEGLLIAVPKSEIKKGRINISEQRNPQRSGGRYNKRVTVS